MHLRGVHAAHVRSLKSNVYQDRADLVCGGDREERRRQHRMEERRVSMRSVMTVHIELYVAYLRGCPSRSVYRVVRTQGRTQWADKKIPSIACIYWQGSALSLELNYVCAIVCMRAMHRQTDIKHLRWCNLWPDLHARWSALAIAD